MLLLKLRRRVNQFPHFVFSRMQTEDFTDNNMMNLANEQKMTSFFAGEIEGKEPLLDEWEVSI